MNDLTRRLSEQTFMRGMEEEHLALLAACAIEDSFEPNELIVREGDPATAFYVIEAGRAAIEIFLPQKGPVIVETVGPGDVLGWSWLIEPHLWHFDAQALEPVRALVFDAEQVHEACRVDAQLGYALLQRFVPVIVRRLQATCVQLLDLYHVAP